MKTLPLLFTLLTVVACDSDDTTPDPGLQDQDIPDIVEPVPDVPEVDPKDEALDQLGRGDFEAALPALEAILAENAEDATLWYALELCALGSGKPAELLDRLSVTEAIGGQALQHHTLRATLALAAGRSADALDAAHALRTADPAIASTMLAHAAQQGASIEPDTLDASLPGDALVLLALEKNDRKRLTLLEAATQLEGWRPAQLRAEILLDMDGQQEAALAELDKVAASDDPRAVQAAARKRLSLTEDPALAAPIALAASTSALAAHDTLVATELLALGVDLLLQQGLADQAFDATSAALAALPEGPSLVRRRGTAAHVDAQIATGQAAAAVALAGESLDAEGLGDEGQAVAQGLARASWRICNAEGLELAAKHVSSAQVALVQGLKDHCDGDLFSAREKLSSPIPSGAIGVDIALAKAWAWFGEPEAVPAAGQAVATAQELGWTTNTIEAGLALERHARVTGQLDVAANAVQALQDGASPALQSELWARTLSQGAQTPPPAASDGEPTLVASWRTLATTPAATDDAAPTKGIAAWAEGRSALRAGTVTAGVDAFKRAFAELPSRRQGRWGPLMALDGADGPSVDVDVALALALVGRGGEDALLALHEFSHFRDFQRLTVNVGYDWTHGLDAEAAGAYTAAHAREQARSLLWLAGTADFPTDAREATVAAIPEIGCLKGMAAPMDVNDVRKHFEETALFSIRLGHDTGELLLVTPSTTKVKRFDNPDALRGYVQSYLDSLNTGRAFGGGATDPRPGDRFRHEVVDSVVGDLVGIARYLVVADPDLLRLPWAVLPEQVEGRRYLADIRTVSSLPYVGAPREDTTEPPNGYKPDFLGLSLEKLPSLEEMTQEELAITDEVTRTMLEAGLKPQGETTSIARLFGGGYSEVKTGAEVTKAAFDDSFPTTRYLHLSGIPAARGAGFSWVDGETLLPQLACGSTATKLAVISTGPSPEAQLVRAQALRDAGATGVLVAMWNPPPILRSRYLTSVYDALNRERAPARALAEARETLVNTLGSGGEQADPSYWGAFLYFGAP